MITNTTSVFAFNQEFICVQVDADVQIKDEQGKLIGTLSDVAIPGDPDDLDAAMQFDKQVEGFLIDKIK